MFAQVKVYFEVLYYFSTVINQFLFRASSESLKIHDSHYWYSVQLSVFFEWYDYIYLWLVMVTI